jgi:Histidine kinase
MTGPSSIWVAAAMQLRVIQRLATDPSRPVEHLVTQVADGLQQAIAELRNLAHGIYPPQLAELGLEAALRAAAVECPLPVTITVDLDGRHGLMIDITDTGPRNHPQGPSRRARHHQHDRPYRAVGGTLTVHTGVHLHAHIPTGHGRIVDRDGRSSDLDQPGV